MPKKLLWHSNERVDLKDLEYGTSTYANEVQKLFIERVGLDNYNRIVDGFRVKVTAPLTITVYNGVAFDRSGQLVNDELSFNNASTLTLGASNAENFVEVELNLVESDQEPRAFWDSSYDNGVDTSGDDLPDGREFKETVSTRKTPTWKVLVNTTAFQSSSIPSSVRIPIAIVKVVGGEISASTDTIRTVTRKDVASSATSLYVFNARHFEVNDSITISLGGVSETKTITAVDKENGILTVSALTNSYVAGARVNATGRTGFITERTSPIPPSTGTVDARRRYFQADDDLGFALSQDPYSDSGRSDLTIDNEKNYKDFLASQLRELKFGGLKASEVGNKAPASSFASAPRYYDFAGSVLGGRAHTVSVGDGVNSWGDFNSDQVGSAQAALQAAHDALPTEGGIIYLKKGIYSVTGSSSFIISKNVILIGDGRDVTIINGDSTASIVKINNATAKVVQLYNINFEVTNNSASTPYGFECVNDQIIFAENCAFTNAKFRFKDPSNYHFQSGFYNCVFLNSIVADDIVRLNALEIQGSFAIFDGCSFVNTAEGSTASSATLIKTVGTVESVFFRGCRFFDYKNLINNFIYFNTTCKHVGISDSYFKGTGSASVGVYISASATVSNLTVDNCRSEIDYKFFSALSGCSNIEIKNSTFSFLGVGASTKDIIKIHSGGTSKFITISNCSFTQTTTEVGIVNAVNLGASTNVGIINCDFENCQYGIKSLVASKVTVDGCKYYGTVASKAKGLFLVEGSDSVSELNINNCTVYTAVGGIVLSSTMALSNIVINSCEFKTIGSTSGGSYYAVYMSVVSNVTVTNNIFDFVNSSSTASGVYILPSSGGKNYNVSGNTLSNVGTNNETTDAYPIFINSTYAYSKILINSNIISGVGHGSISTGNVCGVFAGCDDDSCSSLVISNNSIDGIYNDGVAIGPAGIRLYNGIADAVVKSNNIKTNSPTAIGISLEKPFASARFIKNVAIDSNIITKDADADLYRGINFATGNSDDSCLTISNNSVTGFNESGINVYSDILSLMSDVTINGNQLCTAIDPAYTGYGISVSGVRGTSISGNRVNFTNDIAKRNCFGVSLVSCDDGNISSNHLEVNDTGAYVIGLNTVNRCSVFSNYLSNKTGSTSKRFVGITTYTKIVVLNNVFIGADTVVTNDESEDMIGPAVPTDDLVTRYCSSNEILTTKNDGNFGNIAFL